MTERSWHAVVFEENVAQLSSGIYDQNRMDNARPEEVEFLIRPISNLIKATNGVLSQRITLQCSCQFQANGNALLFNGVEDQPAQSNIKGKGM